MEDNKDDFKSLVKYSKPVIVSALGNGENDKREINLNKEGTTAEDILNSILPPWEYTKDK